MEIKLPQLDFAMSLNGAFEFPFLLRDGVSKQPIDLTDFSFQQQLRPEKRSSTVLLTNTTANGRIIHNSTGGIVTIKVPLVVLVTLDFDTVYHDILWKHASWTDPKPLLEGNVTGNFGVTRWTA
jgi:hypothetical protein